MKTKTITLVILTVFLSSMLTIAFIVPAIAENPVISEVERLKDVCWFHLMTGQYPNGVTVRDVPYEEKGYLGLTYRNLSPDWQIIRLTISPSANHAFEGWLPWWDGDEIESYNPAEGWIEWGVPPDEWTLMTDLWFIGWDAGQQIEVTLELRWPYYDVLYQGTLTIMPLGP